MRCSEGLTRFGGHAAAAGLKLAALNEGFAGRFDPVRRDLLYARTPRRRLDRRRGAQA
ncbi:MAG: hypothetical protein U0800_07140 [Isosphaeraceae bacterium]